MQVLPTKKEDACLSSVEFHVSTVPAIQCSKLKGTKMYLSPGNTSCEDTSKCKASFGSQSTLRFEFPILDYHHTSHRKNTRVLHSTMT
jgi:hypothetical protein